MRLFAYAALSLAFVVLPGCGDGDGESSASWGGPPAAGADGTVDIHGFADYAASVEETWEASPTLAAGEFLRLDRRAATTTSIVARSGPEGMGPTVVTATLDGLPDDSVRAERWTLTFAPEDGAYRLVEARRTQRCRPNRGHQEFGPQRCV